LGALRRSGLRVGGGAAGSYAELRRKHRFRHFVGAGARRPFPPMLIGKARSFHTGLSGGFSGIRQQARTSLGRFSSSIDM